MRLRSSDHISSRPIDVCCLRAELWNRVRHPQRREGNMKSLVAKKRVCTVGGKNEHCPHEIIESTKLNGNVLYCNSNLKTHIAFCVFVLNLKSILYFQTIKHDALYGNSFAFVLLSTGENKCFDNYKLQTLLLYLRYLKSTKRVNSLVRYGWK